MTMTRKHAKRLLTQRMIDAAQSARKTTFILEAIEPVVIGYKRAILENHQFRADASLNPDIEGALVLDPEHAYLLSDEDYWIYAEECNEARIKAALIVDNPGQCPLLVAQEMQRKAQKELIDAMESLTGVSLDQGLRLIRLPDNRFEQLISLCMSMVINLTKADGERV
ncbi:hypothetical protein [Methylomicrobium agile]|uniref:hypothetical protein n=1 Tax=Methylomicrobium agile TaxID=39774 RepID=UPI0004DF73C0|nr:hypothetical protein [Methylomicrobium agile]